MGSEQKRENCNSLHEEDEEENDEEALSLSDLPIKHKKNRDEDVDEEEESRPLIKTEEEFNFRSWSCGGSVLRESEMCSAEDVFFQGQILPLRHSISSETCLTRTNPIQSVSRSESMDRGSSMGFNSTSRSSSLQSSSSTSSNTRNPNPKIINQFHTHPSPKPQIRASVAHQTINRSRKSSIWEFFRLGLVSTPKIELQDLKIRNSISRNSSSGSSSNENSKKQSMVMEKQRKEKKSQMLSGCSCSMSSTVKPVPLNNIVIVKSGSNRDYYVNDSSKIKGNESSRKSMEELMMKTKEKKGKKTESRNRTFEWIKELSHGDGDYPNEAFKLVKNHHC